MLAAAHREDGAQRHADEPIRRALGAANVLRGMMHSGCTRVAKPRFSRLRPEESDRCEHLSPARKSAREANTEMLRSRRSACATNQSSAHKARGFVGVHAPHETI